MIRITQIVNSVFNSNTYILSDDKSYDCWLMDIGDIHPILDYLSDNQNVKGVFITHTHYDHIYGLIKLLDKFPTCTIYTSENGRAGLLSDRYNFSRYHEDSIIFESENIRIVSEGDLIQLNGKEKIEVFETPGHDWSCLSYKLGDKNFFTGDSYIPGLKVITTFPKSNKNEAEKSLEKIKLLLSNGDIVHPGHGEIIKHINK